MDLYLAYADAMVAAARRMNQKILFAWEPLLGNLRGSKPFSPEEESIYANVARTPEQGEQYERTRLFLRDYFAREGVGYFDPSEALRTHSGTVFIDYAHYTAGGNRFVGEHLAAQVSPIIAGQP